MEDEEEGQTPTGMTAEEKGEAALQSHLTPSSVPMPIIPTAQMATSIPIAKALLKDVKPPIADDTIADSLWHYWFDVDKAVTYLRKDWEKKG